MAFQTRTLYKRFLDIFLGRFSENNVWFVAFPFFNIFKFCGFYPARVSFEKHPDLVFYQNWTTCFLTIVGMIGVTVGFLFGVNVLAQFESLGLHKNKTVIAYITSWTQIFGLFIMGILVVVTSWTNTTKLRRLIAMIRHIDRALEMTGAEVSYKAVRKKFFIQTAASLVIPACLSMVNCILIKTPFKVSSSCYWFICFLPILMLTLKELQFYNLMFLLKGKFGAINLQLCESQFLEFDPMSVVCKCSDKAVRKRFKAIEWVRSLAEIYSAAADCVDAVLDIFASHLLMTTCASFAVVTIQIYNLFALIMHSLSMPWHAIGFTLGWIVVQVLVIGVNVVACSQTSKVFHFILLLMSNSFYSASTAMSFELTTACKRSLERFLGRFPENSIWFVIYPFFKIFKTCGFYPVRVSAEQYGDVVFYRDRKACALTVLCLIGSTVGFACGVHSLSHLYNIGQNKSTTVISHITNWAQIFSLFVLGFVAVVTSWMNLGKMERFVAKIRQIDFALEMAGARITYKAMRKRLFIQIGVSLIIPTCLSMVNCIMIKSPFTGSSSCYWFICFWPLLVLTLKELQFFNIMFLLKGKFHIINQQIGRLCDSQPCQNSAMNVISKSSEEAVLLIQKHSKLAEQMRTLAEIYSDMADCVDEVIKIFEIHLLMTTCTSFAVITIQSYNLFALIMHSLVMQIYEIVVTVAWIIVQIMVIGVNVIACSQTSRTMADTGRFLHKLKPREDSGMFLQVMQLFSLEILHRRKPLTAAGFFDMDFKLFTSIVAAVTTYLIIIIQFHLANLQLNSAKNQTTS